MGGTRQPHRTVRKPSWARHAEQPSSGIHARASEKAAGGVVGITLPSVDDRNGGGIRHHTAGEVMQKTALQLQLHPQLIEAFSS